MVLDPTWKSTAAALRVVEDRLPSWLAEEMEDEARPVLEKVRTAAERTEVRGGPTRHTGLRSRVAAGVGFRTSVGSTPYLRFTTSMADPSEASIPRGLDQTQGWRHPLYGDKRHWFQSVPERPGWFTDTIADSRDEFERALEDALERAAETIDRAG